uniref:Ovochymase-2 n=1 Tax=Leptobrachium leishanense TaxID=445787 RepID=A0A8C5N1I5_9ANUR
MNLLQVSLKRDRRHFCGGTIVSSTHIVTAAHCIVDRTFLEFTKVYVGDHDFSAPESTEVIFSVKDFKKHPNFNPNKPINYDIAIVMLDGNITFDERIQPVCLPNPDDIFEPGFLCVALGWGRLQENGILPKSLQEVSLPIIESQTCSSVMATLKGSLLLETVICAGFPDGGKDACQGDSGGPLVCRRVYGSWVLVGITSFGFGCAREWDNNAFIPTEKRGSPGIFTDVQKLLHWVFVNLDKDTTGQILPSARCSVKDGLLTGSNGNIVLPIEPQKYYKNNELCKWIVKVPRGMAILLNFTHFDVEPDFSCDLDYLAVYSEEGQLTGKFCGDVLPRPILVSYNTVLLAFFSDFQQYRTGFAVTYSAVDPHTYQESHCGSLAVHFNEGEIQSMNYPNNYVNFANCHWIIHAPKYFNIKLVFWSFDVEACTNCTYDSVKVFQDLAAEDEIGNFCGFSIPDSITSSSNIMVIKFNSDATENFKGFRGSFAFVATRSLFNIGTFWKASNQPHHNKEEMERFDAVCGISPIRPRFLFSKLLGGEEAITNSWPWHASVQFAGKHRCDGAIIADSWILTAASCVYPSKELIDLYLVVTGLHDLSRSEHDQRRSVKQIFVPSEFTQSSMDYNIALLRLTEPLQLNTFIRPVCLPENDIQPKPSSVCVITGWGLHGNGESKAAKLQQLEVPILLQGTCKAYYADRRGGITDRMFCAGFPSGKGDYSCTDQSGGPLVCQLDNSRAFSVLGIVNWGVNCKENHKPGVYTKVSLFNDWIRHLVNGSAKATEKPIVQLPNQYLRKNEGEQLNQTKEDTVYQESASSNESASSLNVYFATGCEDVVLLEPGEIRLDTKGEAYPTGFRCQWRIVAPKDQIIKLDLQQLHMPTDSKKCCNSLVIYEGVSSGKVLKAQLTADMVPCTVWSEGSALTVELSASAGDLQLGFRILYSFHDTK